MKSTPIALTAALATALYYLLAPPPPENIIPASDIYVVDGDTIRVDGDSYRLAGFNTPETRTAECESERVAGYEAKERLRQLLDAAEAVRLDIRLKRNGEPAQDKYRRRIGDLFMDGASVAEVMISEGHAERYEGGTRRNWCLD